jgi:hypothetical protein
MMSIGADPVAIHIRMQMYISQAKNSENAVLQYNRGTDRLRPWEW